MDISIDWLETELAKAERELIQARQRFEDAQKRMETIQNQVNSFSEVLKRAKEAQSKETQGGSSVKPALNMPDHMAEILRREGRPLSKAEIFDFLKQEGWEKTTLNSVGTQLNRNKPERFNKNDENLWYPVATEEEGHLTGMGDR